MAEKKETIYRRKLVKELKLIPKVYITSVQQLAIVGTPDLLLCVAGNFVAIEIKKDKFSNPTAMQKHNLELVEKAGGWALLAYPEVHEQILETVRMIAEKGEAA